MNFDNNPSPKFAFVAHFRAYTHTTQIHKIAAVLALTIIGIGLGVGFNTAINNAREKADTEKAFHTQLFNAYQIDLTNKLSSAASLASAAGGFAMGLAENPTNWTLASPQYNTSERMVYLEPNTFDQLCEQIYLPWVTCIVLAPGGVITQVYPQGALRTGTDLLEQYDDIFNLMYQTGKTVIGGPNRLVARDGHGIIVWFPVFTSRTNKTKETFWGPAYAVLEIDQLLHAMGVEFLASTFNLEYALWFTAPENPEPIVLAASDFSVTNVVMTSKSAMQAELPIAQNGRRTFCGIYPRGGPLSPTIAVSTAVIIVVAVLIIMLVVIMCLYTAAFALFLYRHRHAPAEGTRMYVAALTLRGAQPIAERAPLEAVRMFTDFTTRVRRLAVERGCYAVCDIGDRTLFVVSQHPEPLISLAKSAVFDVSIRGSVEQNPNGFAHGDHNDETSTAAGVRDEKSPVTKHLTTNIPLNTAAHLGSPSESSMSNYRHTSTAVSERCTSTSQQSSFINVAVCRPSIAIHAVSAALRTYEPAKDMYFYCNAAQLGKLCAAVDGTKGGEVGWTPAFEKDEDVIAADCRHALESASVSSHTVSEGNEVVLHIASLWKETGDERDNEDPSVAMAALSDAFIKRMTAIITEGRSFSGKGGKHKGGSRGGNESHSGSKVNSSEKSADATSVTRNATLLHIQILTPDGTSLPRMPLDIVRGIVNDEKGAVVSAHDSTIVAAFNLLSPGGHHQIRAADTVMRLRAALSSASSSAHDPSSPPLSSPPLSSSFDVPFVCSIHHGRVTALIADGLVMCSGETVVTGRALLAKAVEAAGAAKAFRLERDQQEAVSGSAAQFSESRESFQIDMLEKDCDNSYHREDGRNACNMNGLCLLLFRGDVSSAYECEAVDLVVSCPSLSLLSSSFASPASSQRVLYRLAYRKAKNSKGAAIDDEWMYQLRDEEDSSPFAAVNLVFAKLASNEIAEAATLWLQRIERNTKNNRQKSISMLRRKNTLTKDTGDGADGGNTNETPATITSVESQLFVRRSLPFLEAGAGLISPAHANTSSPPPLPTDVASVYARIAMARLIPSLAGKALREQADGHGNPSSFTSQSEVEKSEHP